MTRYKITIEYDGTNLSGWQKQKNALSVQQYLDEAIFAFSQERPETIAAGRTDAGVHARGQVVSFDLTKSFSLYNIQQGLNFHLQGKPLSVLKAEEVPDDFSARFSAKKRHYLYHIINRSAPIILEEKRAWQVFEDLDIYNMREAAHFLHGNHDFTSFRSTECQAKSAQKTLDNINIRKEGENIFIEVSALSFLHNMVRNIVGTLKLAGTGKIKPEDIIKILEARDRSKAGQTAPACGLYFMKVEY